MKKTLHVAVTGAAGQIAYSLLFRLASGEAFGPDQPIVLHLAELPVALKALEGVKMELEDSAFPLLEGIRIGSDPKAVFEGIDWALLLGSKPRGAGMERKDLLTENGKIFIEQGRALAQSASKSVKVLVVGNPCNTNALIALKQAAGLNLNNFFAMTRLDQNRSEALLALKSGQPVAAVKNLCIWGNHSSTQVPDFYHAKIGGKKVLDVIEDEKWLQTEFVSRIQKRGAEVIEARGKSSAASAASAVIDTIHALMTPTPPGEWFSLGVFAKNNPYGINEELMFSFPCRSKGDAEWQMVPDLELNGWLKEKIALSERELMEEREAVL